MPSAHHGFPYPGPNVSDAPRMLGPPGALLLLATLLCAARIAHRITPSYRLGWDDYTITVALVFAWVGYACNCVAVAHGLGRHTYYVSTPNMIAANHFSFIAQPFWAWSVCLIKVSVACMLLRIKDTRSWKWFLGMAIGIQIASALGANISQLVQCRPLHAVWDPAAAPDAVCWKPIQTQISAYVNAGISIVSDIVLSLLPISFLRHMNRPTRERLVLGALMGLGLFASAAAIVKTTYIYSYGSTKDPLFDVVDLSLWNSLEQDIGIIAACIPCLKQPAERLLKRVGLVSTTHRSRQSGYYPHNRYPHSHEMGSIHTTVDGGEWKRGRQRNDDANSDDSVVALAKTKPVAIAKTTEVTYNTEEISLHTREGKSDDVWPLPPDQW